MKVNSEQIHTLQEVPENCQRVIIVGIDSEHIEESGGSISQKTKYRSKNDTVHKNKQK